MHRKVWQLLKFSLRLKIWVGPEKAAFAAEKIDEENIAEIMCEAHIENYIREHGSCVQQQLGRVCHKIFCVFNILDNFIKSISNKKK